MKIQNMFQKDIERDINGVIKVMQDDDRSLEQELSEYIITQRLSTSRLIKSACGFPASLEVVNLIS